MAQLYESDPVSPDTVFNIMTVAYDWTYNGPNCLLSAQIMKISLF